MKIKIQKTGKLVVFFLGFSTASVMAQIPVTVTTDIVAMANQFQTMSQWAEQLKQMRKQYDELHEQYNAIVGSYGRGAMGLAESIKSSSAVPGSWQEVVAQQKNGEFGSKLHATEQLIKTLPQHLFINPQGQDATDYKLSTDAVRAALTGGTELYAQVQKNLLNLTDMAKKVDETINVKDAADLLNRIAAENGILQSAMAKLNVMNINLQANMLNQQNQAISLNQQRYKRSTTP